jgi:hypothetical protein
VGEIESPLRKDAANGGRPDASRVESDSNTCQTCGLPLGRKSFDGPYWTPEVKGVEVCGCPDQAERDRQHAATLHHDLEKMEEVLHEIASSRSTPPAPPS